MGLESGWGGAWRDADGMKDGLAGWLAVAGAGGAGRGPCPAQPQRACRRPPPQRPLPLQRLPGCPAPQEAHIAKLRAGLDTGGDASLQNALDLAVDSLRSIPPYGSRWGKAGRGSWRRGT